MFCTKCGSKLKVDAKFCGRCGTLIKSTSGFNGKKKNEPDLARSKNFPSKNSDSKTYENSSTQIRGGNNETPKAPISFLWIGSTILTGIIIQSLSSFLNFNIFSWSILFVLPAGAFGTSYLNLIIIGLVCKIFRIKPQGNLVINATISTFIIILMLANTDPAASEITIRYRSAVSSGIAIPPFWAWVLWLIKIIGFWLNSIGNYKEVLQGFKD
tara:strand:- start:27 stop:665 length:639 start_codon:yes stop_codon:yes gene_type:complete